MGRVLGGMSTSEKCLIWPGYDLFLQCGRSTRFYASSSPTRRRVTHSHHRRVRDRCSRPRHGCAQLLWVSTAATGTSPDGGCYRSDACEICIARSRSATPTRCSGGTLRQAIQARSSSVAPRRPRSSHRSRRRSSPGPSPLAAATAAFTSIAASPRPDRHRLHSVTSASVLCPSVPVTARRETESTAVMIASSGYSSPPAMPHSVHM